MLDPDAAPAVPIERAARRVREAAWAAIVPLPMVAVWWVVFPQVIQRAPAGAEVRWTAELTAWLAGGGLPLPFAVGVALLLFGPSVSAAAGLVLLWRLRHDPPRVPAACTLAAALSVVALGTAPWVSVTYAWEHRTANGMQGASVNLSPSLCCGGLHLLVAAWLAFAAIRYAPVFRDAAQSG